MANQITNMYYYQLLILPYHVFKFVLLSTNQVSARTAAERVEELAVEQEMKSKQLRAQRLEAQEQAGRVEVSPSPTPFSVLSYFAYRTFLQDATLYQLSHPELT